jgi:hypothetical protein
MHFLNYEFVLINNLQFKYFSLHASNEFFILKGAFDYMSKYEAGYEIDKVENF